MRVLYLTNLRAPYRMLFFEKLGKLCDLTVLIERETAYDRDINWFEQDNINTFKIISMKGIHISNDSAFNPSVLRWLSKRKFDIIVVGGYSSLTEILAILYMRLRRISFVLSVDGGFAEKDEHILKRKLKQLLVSSACHWLASGRGAGDFLEFYGADCKKTFIYPFASVEDKDILKEPLSVPEKENYKRLLGLDGRLLVLSIGRFIPCKGFEILLDAWGRLTHENCTLAIIGGGPLKTQYLNSIKNSQIKNTIILDFMKKEELLTWYRSADVFVLPTHKDIWGLVVNEAMAQGLPVISTNSCLAALELVRNGENGYIVDTGDVKALTICMEQLINDGVLRKNMSACALKTIIPYTIENMVHSHIQAFNIIAGSR